MPNDQLVEKKEQFDSTLDEEKLLSQIELWEKESEDYYGLLKEVWDKNSQYYFGNQTDLDKVRGKQSKAVENRIFMATETMIPIATSRLPDIEVRPGDEDEQSQMDADDLKDVIAYEFERIGIQEKAERFLRNMIVYRYGVFKIGWHKGEDDISIKVVSPKRIRVPRYGMHIDDLAFVIEELEMTYGQIKEFFGKEKADKVLESFPKDGENKIRKNTHTIKEVWTNDFVVWATGREILDKKDNPFYKKDGDNFFLWPKKPYVIKSLFETEESILGDTDYIQQMISIQDNINIRKRQTENIIGKVANPVLLIDSEVMSEEQAANITNEEGLILYGRGAADGTKIRYENPGQVSNYLFLDLESSRTQFDNIWGIHSTTRGERQGKETLGGRQLLKEADLGRIDLIARQLERSLDELAEWITQLIKLYFTEEKSFTLKGEDGVRFIKNFSNKKVGSNVKPMVLAGSTLPKDELTQRQEAIQLWQLQAIGVKTLYKKLKLSNQGDALQDFIDTRSGKIFGGQPPQ
jgi:hypothetical protein